MGQASTIGLDITKWVFQAHGADATGRVVFRKRLVRAKVLEFFAGQPPCLVALEACRMVGHRKIKAKQGEDRADQPLDLAQRQAKHGSQGQSRGDRHARVARLPTPLPAIRPKGLRTPRIWLARSTRMRPAARGW